MSGLRDKTSRQLGSEKQESDVAKQSRSAPLSSGPPVASVRAAVCGREFDGRAA